QRTAGRDAVGPVQEPAGRKIRRLERGHRELRSQRNAVIAERLTIMMKCSLIRLMIALAGAAMMFAAPAHALVETTINKGNVEPVPVAVTEFIAANELGAQISQVIAADLQRSGLFAPVDKGAFIEKVSNPDQQPRFEDWKVINAQALVTGRVTREADGRLRAEFRLWDTFAGQQMTGQQFFTQPENWRRVAHIIADAIYE